METPDQFSSDLGTVTGQINGANKNFAFQPSIAIPDVGPGAPHEPNTGFPGQILPGFRGSQSQPTTAVASLLFLAGQLQTQPLQGSTSGNAAIFVAAPVPGQAVSVVAWAPNPTYANEPVLNLPRQFSTADGSLVGGVDGANNVFVLVTGSLVTQILLWWRGNFLQEGSQYTWSCVQNSSAGPWVTTVTTVGGNIPAVGDVVTVQAFMT